MTYPAPDYCAMLRTGCKYPDECPDAGRCLISPQPKPADAEPPSALEDIQAVYR